MGIVLKDISKKYNIGTKGECTVLNKINLRVDEGELVSIIGKSGAGKSTLMHIIGCLDEPSDGEYYLDEQIITGYSQRKLATLRNKTFGFVLQDFGLIQDEKVLENVMVPMYFSHTSVSQMREKALESLQKLGILNLRERYVEELSGGERQRVAIARALVNNPKYILADEPTGALDSGNAKVIMDVLLELNKEGKTVIIITHDMEIAKQCNRLIEMHDGMILNEK